ncbi:DUF2919 family protein [Idiomarina xiamenensis]|uniref:DUF2919 domain-containing protein n=1 Tax=Idiomarina xiamenensis 10-D-4 TaxID=740709 RepID=K2KQW2_9GAMM|nr:DUF2919 family protein [Idiomarina xiamenensis]EKE79895.1 hypothetical protein A10D4_12348 [Idiomarina xiamenensis 10-D-4]
MLRQGDEYYIDGEGRLRLPLGILLLFAFFLRGYLAWIISLTFGDDRSLLLGYFYQSREQFVLTLLVGLPTMYVLILTCLQHKPWLLQRSWLWRFAGPALWLSWLVDGCLLASVVHAHWPQFSYTKAALIAIWCWAPWFLAKSRHWRRYREILARGEGQ